MKYNKKNDNEKDIKEIDTNKINKTERVFQLDNECYLIYTGSGPDDLKPFLRIGNKPHLDEELISNIGNIIVTDLYTGNPVYEKYNIDLEKIHQNCYVGDGKAVGYLIDFLKSLGIKTDGLKKKVSIRDRENTAYVYFYEDGNIRIYYNKKLLFDLKERETRDLHFLQKVAELIEILRSSPFRVEKQVIDKQGFILTDNNLFLFSHSKLLSLGIKEDFFEELVFAGVDPDLISTVVTEKIDDGLFQLLKRKKATSKEINIATAHPEITKSACKMFTFQGDNPLKYRIYTIEDEKSLKSNGFTIKKNPNRKKQDGRETLIGIENLPFTFSIGEKLENKETETILIHPDLNSFAISISGATYRENAFKNCCYTLHSEQPGLKELIDNYLVEPAKDLDTISGKYMSMVNRQIDNFSKEMKMGIAVPQAAARIAKQIRKVKKTDTYIENLPILNTGKLIKIILENENFRNRLSPKGIKLLKKLQTKISSYQKRLRGLPEIPLYGNIFIIGKKPFTLYKYSPITGFKDGLNAYLQLKTEIKNKKLNNQKKYIQEYEKLKDLISSLKKPVQIERESAGIKPPEIQPKIEPSPRKGVKPKSRKKTYITTGIIILAAAGVIGFLAFYNHGNTLKIPARKTILESETKSRTEGSSQKSTGEPLEGFIFHKAEESKTTSKKITEIVKKEISEEQVSKTQTPEEHYIVITIKDIFLLTNKIARDNGYRELNSQDDIGKDPNWIYPGNIFKLPDGNRYEVVKGDTLWYISYRYIRKQVDNDYIKAMDILATVDKNKNNRKYLIETITKLEKIREESYSENFKNFIDENIRKINEMI